MTNQQREHQALQLRYDALSRDWNRQRDVEQQWGRLFRITLGAAGVVMCLAALGVML